MPQTCASPHCTVSAAYKTQLSDTLEALERCHHAGRSRRSQCRHSKMHLTHDKYPFSFPPSRTPANVRLTNLRDPTDPFERFIGSPAHAKLHALVNDGLVSRLLTVTTAALTRIAILPAALHA